MEAGELKPIVGALLLPPGGPLLLALAGAWLMRWRKRAGAPLLMAGLASLWFLSCNAVALELAHGLLRATPPLTPAQLAGAQAIVVLGGGVRAEAPEYGMAQPAGATLARLRYAVRLARASGKPLAFAGGVGWTNAGSGTASEAEVARRVAQEEYGVALRWVDAESRDTQENASHLAQLLQRDGVRRIALVTDALAMRRAELRFREAGFDVIPAPVDAPGRRERDLLEWLPSAHGLALSRYAIRERVALAVAEVD